MNADMIRAFELVLMDEKELFICERLILLKRAGRISKKTCAKCHSHIKKLLDGRSTLGGWIREHHPEAYKRYRDTDGAPRQSRRQWLEHIIATLKEGEK